MTNNNEQKEVNFQLNETEIDLQASDIITHPSEDNVLLKEGATELLQVAQEGRKYKTLLTKKFANRKVWKAPNPKEVRSIIPGSVTSINVVEGASVKKGDKLMEYEAMKMHNIIVAPMDATVKKIMVSVGEKLPKGAILIVLK